MLSFLATTENIKYKNRTTELQLRESCQINTVGNCYSQFSVVENESRAVLSDIGDRTITKANQESTEPERTFSGKVESWSLTKVQIQNYILELKLTSFDWNSLLENFLRYVQLYSC